MPLKTYREIYSIHIFIRKRKRGRKQTKPLKLEVRKIQNKPKESGIF